MERGTQKTGGRTASQSARRNRLIGWSVVCAFVMILGTVLLWWVAPGARDRVDWTGVVCGCVLSLLMGCGSRYVRERRGGLRKILVDGLGVSVGPILGLVLGQVVTVYLADMVYRSRFAAVLERAEEELDRGKPEVAMVRLRDVESEARGRRSTRALSRAVRLEGDAYRVMYQPWRAMERYELSWYETTGTLWLGKKTGKAAESALASVRSPEKREEIMHVVRGLAELACMEGRDDDAVDLFRTAETLANGLGSGQERFKAKIRLGMAEMYRVKGMLPQADSELDSLVNNSQLGRYLGARVEACRGRVEYCRAGKSRSDNADPGIESRHYEQAVRHYLVALSISLEGNPGDPMASILPRNTNILCENRVAVSIFGELVDALCMVVDAERQILHTQSVHMGGAENGATRVDGMIACLASYGFPSAARVADPIGALYLAIAQCKLQRLCAGQEDAQGQNGSMKQLAGAIENAEHHDESPCLRYACAAGRVELAWAHMSMGMRVSRSNRLDVLRHVREALQELDAAKRQADLAERHSSSQFVRGEISRLEKEILAKLAEASPQRCSSHGGPSK